jgi:hypothetical protein
MSRFITRSRAGIVALALGAGIGGSLALPAASLAAAGTPTAGTACQGSDGKITGRGATLQIWGQYDLMGAYSSDVCGPVASQGANDQSDPGSAISTLPGGTTYAQNWMTAYDDTSAQSLGSSGADAAIGSGAGQTSIGCMADAFGGSDIPATATQRGNINSFVFTSGANGFIQNGKDCLPKSGANTLTQQFTPLPNAAGDTSYPEPGDNNTLSPSGIMTFPVMVSAIAIFANLPSTCVPASPAVLTLSNADMQNIWGGADINWDQITDAGFVAGSPCTTAGGGVPIQRVVRSDNSGTTQNFDNYLADLNPAATYGTSTTGICAGNTKATAGTWKAIQNNQVTNGSNANNWPTGGSCVTPFVPLGAGAPALIEAVECGTTTTSSNTCPGPANANGWVGYADLSDTQHDTNNFHSLVTGNVIAEFNLTSSTGGTVAPGTSTGASNCSPTASLPGTGSASQAVGLGGEWNLTAETAPNGGPDDIGFAKEGSSYPNCAITWDMVWTGDDGNAPNENALPSNLNNVAANATTIALDVSTVLGTPNSFTSGGASGSITVPATGGTDTISYTGMTVTYNAAPPTNSLATVTLTGVTGDTFPIPAETSFNYPAGTGGPEANLTADQRRTLYSYFTYLTSPAAQNSLLTAGYASLPTSWLTPIRAGFQANF